MAAAVFDAHQVADDLWVGSCPASPERIVALREAGIRGLVSVQTDQDLASIGMSWPLLWRFLMANGIACARHPIVDFDERALRSGLAAAVDAVDQMIAAGRPTLLHCTAGVNRSPTVAIAWLARARGLTLDEAWAQVTTRRPCAPNRVVLAAFLAPRSA